MSQAGGGTRPPCHRWRNSPSGAIVVPNCIQLSPTPDDGFPMRFRLPAGLSLLALTSLACAGGSSGGAGAPAGANADRQALVRVIDSIVSKPIDRGEGGGRSAAGGQGQRHHRLPGLRQGRPRVGHPDAAGRDLRDRARSPSSSPPPPSCSWWSRARWTSTPTSPSTCNYPTKGRKIAVRHLLDHTSGIRGTPRRRAPGPGSGTTCPRFHPGAGREGAVRLRARHHGGLQQLGVLPGRPAHREGRAGCATRTTSRRTCSTRPG